MSKADRQLMIELENVDKFFGSFQALKGVNLTRSEDTRLNSSHKPISYAVFCLKKKNTKNK